MSNAQKVSELLPCPFCGDFEFEVAPHTYPSEDVVYGIICEGCGGQTTGNYTTPLYAAAAWNRRAAPTPDAHSEVEPSMSDLVEQIEALLALNAKGAVSHRVPGLAVELLERAAAALTAGAVKAEPVAVTDEMVERAYAEFMADKGSGPDGRTTRQMLRDTLTAALASKPEGER